MPCKWRITSDTFEYIRNSCIHLTCAGCSMFFILSEIPEPSLLPLLCVSTQAGIAYSCSSCAHVHRFLLRPHCGRVGRQKASVGKQQKLLALPMRQLLFVAWACCLVCSVTVRASDFPLKKDRRETTGSAYTLARWIHLII